MKILGDRRGMGIFFLLLFSFFLQGCSFQKTDPKPKEPAKINPISYKNPAPSNERGVPRHPYGNPVQGALPWDNAPRFQTIIAKANLKIRMAAFQTTLPDPLPGEESNVALGADLLAGKVVKPGAVFSMNQAIGPYSQARGFREGPAYYGPKVIKVTGGGVCKIASTLYNVTTLANLKIIERNPHSMPVPYVPPGQDATVSSKGKDFRFQNNTGEPIMIWADTRGNTLYMAFYGRQKSPQIIWGHKILNRKSAPTYYRSNHDLKPGEKKTIIPGADGVTVKSWLTITYPDGRTESKNLGVDQYNPLPHVIERG
jgi:vancomycin resistance protein VanW